MSFKSKTTLLAGLLVGGYLVAGAAAAATSIIPRCTVQEIAGAKSLASQVKALSKTDPAAALKIAENVASSKSSCFQVAFGAALDGTGTASIGEHKKPKGGNDGGKDDGVTGENQGHDHGGGDDNCKPFKRGCPGSRT